MRTGSERKAVHTDCSRQRGAVSRTRHFTKKEEEKKKPSSELSVYFMEQKDFPLLGTFRDGLTPMFNCECVD